MMRTLLQQACNRGEIRLLDLHVGRFLEKLSGENHPELLLAGTLAGSAVAGGHVCLPLDQAAGFPLQLDPALIPEPGNWAEILLATPVVGRPGADTPLILDEKNRLYLYRYYRYEQQIASDLRARACGILEVEHKQARLILDQLFPKLQQSNDQKTAAALALFKRLLIISGGPGTGKTYTVARILALLQALHQHKAHTENTKITKNTKNTKNLRIGLAAPTGKAAARLEESIRRAKESIPAALAENIPEQAKTLHRLLGYNPGEDGFRYHTKNPLHLDLLVLDEASMIDVVLMANLVQALPETTRLILLGDRNQLASVEAGSLFSDLCGTGEPAWSPQLRAQLYQLTGEEELPRTTDPPPAIADSVVLLRTSYRFRDKSGIDSLAKAVNKGSMVDVEHVLTMDFPDLEVQFLTGSHRNGWLQEQIIQGFQAMVGASSVEEAFAAMETFRFLCAVRKGPAGVDGINNLAEQTLQKCGLINPDTDWYQGKPIIIRRNQYEMQLFNGDTGILWQDDDGGLRAWFRHPDNRLYPVSPARLPDHDTAYAITIHKAQGSEFDRVLLLLPEEESRVLSRELLYTGITRARSRLTLCGDPTILATAVKRQTRRYSGLQDRVWET